MPRPEVTSTTRAPANGALTDEVVAAGRAPPWRVDADPALAHRERVGAEQPPRLGEQQLVEALVAERRRRVAVVVRVADDQIAVRQLRDDQVDARLDELRALGGEALAHAFAAGLRRERRVADRAQAGRQRRRVAAAAGRGDAQHLQLAQRQLREPSRDSRAAAPRSRGPGRSTIRGARTVTVRGCAPRRARSRARRAPHSTCAPASSSSSAARPRRRSADRRGGRASPCIAPSSSSVGIGASSPACAAVSMRAPRRGLAAAPSSTASSSSARATTSVPPRPHRHAGAAAELEPALTRAQRALEILAVADAGDERVAEVAHARADGAPVALEQRDAQAAPPALVGVGEADDARADDAQVGVEGLAGGAAAWSSSCRCKSIESWPGCCHQVTAALVVGASAVRHL